MTPSVPTFVCRACGEIRPAKEHHDFGGGTCDSCYAEVGRAIDEQETLRFAPRPEYIEELLRCRKPRLIGSPHEF